MGLAVLLSGVAASGRAQISPGELSRAHAGLDGSTKCLECHEAGRGVAADKCLTCHTALGARIQAGRGLHAQAGHQECGRCHIEHHGRDFELVFWGKEGRASFDHAKTGVPLEGAHARLRCDQCHSAKSRTFLGLSMDCASCHSDVHRGRFAPTSCSSCHTQSSFRPVAGFDHSRTRFPLVGEHRAVACDRCHTTDAQSGRRRLAGVAFDSCKSCHADPHKGRQGESCASCHTPAGWRQLSASFDHGRTAFPLTGSHRKVSCDQCHRPQAGSSARLFKGTAFQSCTACHSDPHVSRLGTELHGVPLDGVVEGGSGGVRPFADGISPGRASFVREVRGVSPAGSSAAFSCFLS